MVSDNLILVARELRDRLRDFAVEDVMGLGMVCKLCGARCSGGDSKRLEHQPDCVLRKASRI